MRQFRHAVVWVAGGVCHGITWAANWLCIASVHIEDWMANLRDKRRRWECGV